MASALRVRLGIGSLVLLAVGIAAHALGTWVTFGDMQVLGVDGVGTTSSSTSYVTVAVLSSFGTFCIAAAVVLVAGFVAMLILEERDADWTTADDTELDEEQH